MTRWLLVQLLLLSGPLALSHDVFEITAATRLQPERIELTATMSRGTAMLLLGEEGQGLSLADPFQFATVQALLQDEASQLFDLTSGSTRLKLIDSRVGLNAESEVQYVLVYKRVAANRLRVSGKLLALLKDPNYGVALTVNGERNQWLGAKLLTSEDPSFELAL
jgi:hypothetical protein